ncbi:hypothetical protein SAMN06265222_1335 [Neorhodopirellula lusitana]|uniref:Calcineurin-like phosphoesterase domain-containing protein n=2 Tax=Neorhodopirellula lusitana TaxID=445327 RepID=A0ABY1QW83_9BACT|nr:hypothetical protein SAMN06265222_1335 [Neorhodopirellula lusitana]
MLICGDLACRGNKREYVETVGFLVDALNLSSKQAGTIHVVPGNHDVDRRSCTAKKRLNPKKFDPLREAWTKKYEDVLATNRVRGTALRSGKCELNLYSMNSCIGCGEWRMFPDALRTEMEAVVQKCRDTGGNVGFELEGERLDTPMFDLEHIRKLRSDIDDTALESVPIVLAHHNLLPQELMRVEIYTELINSGQFRTSLVRCNRPVIYCHGHIHTDPIEIISDARLESSQLICVSAPQLVEGFNELQFHFSKDDHPLGLSVLLHRLEPNGLVTVTDELRIAFTNRGMFVSEDTTRLRDSFESDQSRFRKLKSEYDSKLASPTTDVEFADILLEAEWHGLVDLEHKASIPSNWIVRRKMR